MYECSEKVVLHESFDEKPTVYQIKLIGNSIRIINIKEIRSSKNKRNGLKK